MAVKNWLIRTRNKQILGPATKEKVIELIEKGSLTGDDEIASGNGYWMWVREKDLLEKYLYGDIPQTFNPISEAQDVLTAKSSPEGVTASVVESRQKAKQKAESPNVTQLPADDDLAYPEDGDLAYPDEGDLDFPSEPENTFEDNSLTGEIEIGSQLKSTPEPTPALKPEPRPAPVAEPASSEGEDENFIYPSAKDLEYPEDIHGNSTPKVEEEEDQTDPNVQIPTDLDIEEAPVLADSEELEEEYEEDEYEEEEEEEEEPAPKSKKRRRASDQRKGSDRYLFVIAFLIVAAIVVVFYYYKMVLNKPFPLVGISEAHAQTLTSLSKKKIF